MVTRQPFWNWRRWKSIGSYPYTLVLCRWSLELIFKAKLKLESGNHKIQYGRQAVILNLTSLKINRLLPIYISIVPLNFGADIQSQTEVRVRKPKKSDMAARRPFWNQCRWKFIGSCLWPPSTCKWNFKLKFWSKLDLCSGNHVVYRQTNGRLWRIWSQLPWSKLHRILASSFLSSSYRVICVRR